MTTVLLVDNIPFLDQGKPVLKLYKDILRREGFVIAERFFGNYEPDNPNLTDIVNASNPDAIILACSGFANNLAIIMYRHLTGIYERGILIAESKPFYQSSAFPVAIVRKNDKYVDISKNFVPLYDLYLELPKYINAILKK